MKRILLVEDDPILLKMYQKKFQTDGFDVQVALNGEVALNLALKDHYDLILLDLAMPKMDGLTVMKKLREDAWGKTVPIIILTNLDTSDKILQRIIEDQPAYYLMKVNSNPTTVSAKVKEVLGIFSKS